MFAIFSDLTSWIKEKLRNPLPAVCEFYASGTICVGCLNKKPCCHNVLNKAIKSYLTIRIYETFTA